MPDEKLPNANNDGGSLSGGNFKNDPVRAVEAGRKGGKLSPGNFKNSRERAIEAGRKGWPEEQATEVNAQWHPLTQQERETIPQDEKRSPWVRREA